MSEGKTDSEQRLDDNSGSVLARLTLSPEQLSGLPADVRDALLEYLTIWGPPEDLALTSEALRESFGPLLYLLDYLALANFRQGHYTVSLDILERRQRRSPTIAGQVLEARNLMALGHEDHALGLVGDLSRSYPRHVQVIGASAEIYDSLGEFARSRALLEQLLSVRAHDAAALLRMAQHAWRAGDSAESDRFLQRLGAGIPPGMDDEDLIEFAALLAQMHRRESEQAVRLELGRRKNAQFQQIHAALYPLREVSTEGLTDPAAIFQRLNGPESMPVNREERRRIQLEAVRHFGFMQLREGQTEVIAGILRGESLLTVMPTGAGKSLCYQLPALMLPKATLVISPLVALMKDQVEGLPAAARPLATFVNSTLSDAELAQRLQNITAGDYKLIYAAPERLRQLSFLAALRKAEIGLFVLDEAHCVSLWGHDFRPDYLFIQEARAALANPPALAMTATAPPRVRDEIIDYIRNAPEADFSDSQVGFAGLNGARAARLPVSLEADASAPAENGREAHAGAGRPRVLTLDIFRHNLFLSALTFHNEEDKLSATLKLAAELEGSGIVYVNSRHKSESLAFELRKIGVAAEAYHAGIEGRGAVQDRFMANQTRVVVATVAFGMGIDKADIRFIIHFHPARSLAAYYQEVGRAGRDGKPSQGILFYSNNDWTNLRRWAKSGEMPVDFLERVYAAVATQLGVHIHEENAPQAWETVGGPVDSRRLQQILNVDETTTRVAVSILERADLLTRGFDLPQEFTITVAKPNRGKAAKLSVKLSVKASAEADPELTRLNKGLSLRPGEAATFKTADLANFMGWVLDEVEPNLLEWEAQGQLQVQAARRVMFINLPARPVDMRDRLERILAQSTAVAQRRIDDIVGYATSDTCRHGYISAHFGSPPRSACTVCDNCTGIRPELPQYSVPAPSLPDDADVEPMIIDCLLSLSKQVGKSGLARILVGSLRAPVTPDLARHHGRLKALGEAAIMCYIEDMVEEGRLRSYDRQGYPVLAATLRGRGEAERWLAQHPELAEPAAPPAHGADDAIAEESTAAAAGEKYTALQKAIWNWRRRTSVAAGQPPYMIMGNELILRIAEIRPQTLEELGGLPGIGVQRLEYYGPTLIDLVHLHPPQPEDADLLAAQRLALQDGPGASASRAGDESAPVAPRLQRRIFLKLQEVRQKLSVEHRLKSQEIASTALLRKLAESAPGSLAEIQAVPGFATSGLAGQATQILVLIAGMRQADEPADQSSLDP